MLYSLCAALHTLHTAFNSAFIPILLIFQIFIRLTFYRCIAKDNAVLSYISVLCDIVSVRSYDDYALVVCFVISLSIYPHKIVLTVLKLEFLHPPIVFCACGCILPIIRCYAVCTRDYEREVL